MMKKPVQVQDYEKDKEEDEGEVILTSLMGVPVRCKAISGMHHVNVLVNVNVHVGFCIASLAKRTAPTPLAAVGL
jgi:hypothetical protein